MPYNKIIETLRNIIPNEDETIKRDLEMAIEIIEAYELETEKLNQKFQPIIDYNTRVLLDFEDKDYSKICATFKYLAKDYSDEELEMLLQQIKIDLANHLHKHECLQAEARAYKRILENRGNE